MSSTRRDRLTPARQRERILQSQNRFWRTDKLEGMPSTVQHLLADLVAKGELRRVQRGLYWRGVRSPLGMAPPPTDTLVAELAPGPGVGPAGLYAANLLRLSTQVPRRAEIAVPSRAPEAPDSIRFVSRVARSARVKAGLTSTEVALLEVLGAWEATIELPPHEAWARLLELVATPNVSAGRLARAGRHEPAGTRARLARLLTAAGHGSLAAQIPGTDPRTTTAATRVLQGVA